MAYVNEDFPGRNGQIKDGKIYTCGDDSYGFKAGSYGNYTQFRNRLSNLVGFSSQECLWESAKEGSDFYELVFFADNEGILGADISRKLLGDFKKHEDKAKSIAVTFTKGYQDWMKAFELASDNGFADFH